MIKDFFVPTSKSITNRALVLASISDVPTILSGVLDCDDSRVLIQALKNFGVQFEDLSSGKLKVIPPKKLEGKNTDNFIGNAGTSTRFLTALSLITEGIFSLRGVERMHERPFKDLFDAVKSLGGEIAFEKKENFLPAKFTAPILNPSTSLKTGLQSSKESKSPSTPLFAKEGEQGNIVKVSGGISSQFLSGLLLTAPKMPNGLTIEVTDEIKSRPYVEMTLEMLKIWGVKYTVNADFNVFQVSAGITSPQEFAIPADSSSASYPMLWSMLSGVPVCLENYGAVTLQGDEKFLDVVQKAGASIVRKGERVEISPPPKIQPLGEIDFSSMPDVSMTAMMMAVFAEGESVFTGIESLRVKECDRIQAMQEGLQALGIKVDIQGDTMTIFGKEEREMENEELKGKIINSFSDHRIAMVFGVVRNVLKLDFEITHPDCVAKSWPEFWLDLADWSGEMRQVSSIVVQKEDEFLIVKKPREHHAWQFPQGGAENGENGVETAQREFLEECGSALQIEFDSELPRGKYCYFFPKDFKRHREGIRGACVRFYHAEYISGEVQINPEELEDFKWVKKSEFPNYFEGDYLEAIKKIL